MVIPARAHFSKSPGHLGGLLGVLSAVILGAALVYAHHWGPLADTIVASWALATVGALVVSILTLNRARPGRRLARLGTMLGLVSVLALVIAVTAAAAGFSISGACGGG
jgi:hypothetical protein